jgi:two-component system, OmpR family, alkaline phosphatase synthesis response regulator PhoP
MPCMNPLNESFNSILLVEDEESLARGLIYNLEAEGFRVHHVGDGLAALEAFHSQSFDLIILDIMIPHVDGFEVASRIRETDPQMPILILTARTTLKDRLKGLETGADDYLSKPFHLEELLLRVQGMLKRKSWYKKPLQDHPFYRFGDNEINFENLKCQAGRKSFILTPLEAMVMKYLIENKDRVISRRELLEKVWNITSEVETRTVDNFILRLRKYFEPDSSRPIYIKSVRGSGYIFSDH